MFTKEQIHSIVQAFAVDVDPKLRLVGLDVMFNVEKNVYQLQKPTAHLLKNMHKGKNHNQNMGRSILAKCSKLAAKKIKIDPQSYIGTCWRRSGWKSNKVVQGYIVHSEDIKSAHVKALAGAEKLIVDPQVSPKKLKVVEKVPFKPAGVEGDCAASEADESQKPLEWDVCRTAVINNYYISPSKKEE
eukprot:13939067-Ditylum_brightwellii.AAC.1